jgi:hypothetical protein
MNDVSSLTAPILRVNSRHIQRFDRPRDLLVESEYFLSRGAYELGTSLIDARGSLFDISAVQKVRRSYSWKYWGAKHPAWVISLTFEFKHGMSLDEVKEKLLKAIIANKWYLQGDYSPQSLEDEIRSAESFEQLYKRISFFGSWASR